VPIDIELSVRTLEVMTVTARSRFAPSPTTPIGAWTNRSRIDTIDRGVLAWGRERPRFPCTREGDARHTRLPAARWQDDDTSAPERIERRKRLFLVRAQGGHLKHDRRFERLGRYAIVNEGTAAAHAARIAA